MLQNLTNTVKVLLTGKSGQLGYELQRTLPENVELIAFGSEELDITESNSVESIIKDFGPDVVINAAAYTAVDKAEVDIRKAFAVNQTGCANLANACELFNARLIHVSTDFVFDGCCNSPYQVDDKTNPLSVYGKSKLAGEKEIQSILPSRNLIIRTAWVYSSHGNNFVKTMLRLMNEREELGVVYDQIGTPTWAHGLAKLIWASVNQKSNLVNGVINWSDQGVTSWYDFAEAIHEIGLSKGLVKKAISIRPIRAESYPTPAARPAYSVLDKSKTEQSFNITSKHWRKQLSLMLDEL